MRLPYRGKQSKPVTLGTYADAETASRMYDRAYVAKNGREKAGGGKTNWPVETYEAEGAFLSAMASDLDGLVDLLREGEVAYLARVAAWGERGGRVTRAG